MRRLKFAKPGTRYVLSLGVLALFSFDAATPSWAVESMSWTQALESGKAFLAAQNPSLAEVSFRKAVDLVKKQSKSLADQDKCSIQLANALALLDKTVEARTILVKIQSRISRQSGASSKDMAPVLMALGSIEESAGDHSKAMGYYSQALKITESGYGPYSPAAAGALQGMGRAASRLGDRKSAQAHFQRGISILSKAPNLEAADQLKSMLHDYGDLMGSDYNSDKELLRDFQAEVLPAIDHGNLSKQAPSGQSNWQSQSQVQLGADESRATNENESVALRGVHLPSSDSSTLAPMFKVINENVFKDNRYRLSEPEYKRMIASDINSLGPNQPALANDLNGLAQLYMAQGKYADARALMQKALAIYENAYGSDNILTINTMALLASATFQVGRIDEAAKLYQDSLAKAQTVTGPNSLETAKILNGLAYLYFYKGDLERSATFYEWALATTEKAVGSKNPLLAACLKDYAQVLRRLGKVDRADEIELRARGILAQAH